MNIDTEARIPLGIGQLFSQTFGIFFSRLTLFLAITLIPSLVISLVTAVFFGDALNLNRAGLPPVDPGAVFTTGYFAFIFLSVLIGFLILGVTTLAAYDVALGRPAQIGAYVSRTLALFAPLFVLGIAYYLAFSVGILLLIAPGLYVLVRYWVLIPTILVEGAGWNSMTRAAQLSQGYRWPMLGAAVVLAIILIGVSLIVGLLLATLAFNDTGKFVYALLQSASGALTYSIGSIFTALLYARLREIREGLGMEDLSGVFE